MMETTELLRATAGKFKRILAKHKAGKALTAEEREFLGDREAGPTDGHKSYDSIASAAAGLGIEKSVLKKAKRDGAPGFRGSRVYPLELLPWLRKRSDEGRVTSEEDKESLEREFLKVRIERQRFFFECEKGEFVRAADAGQWATTMVSEFAKVLDAVPSTLAPDLVGVSSIAEAELRIRAALERAKGMLHEGPWGSASDE